MSLLAPLLPDAVVVAEVLAGQDVGPLHPAEETAMGRASARRRDDFTRGRDAARRALATLGHPGGPDGGPGGVPVLRDADRRPLWPDGVVGSLTHCPGYAAAAVARAETTMGVGIDAEAHGPLPDGVLDVVARPEEVAALARLPDGVDGGGTSWGRVLFSAKESTFKVWSPLTGTWLGFHDARVTLHPDAATGGGRFDVDLLVTGLVIDQRPVDRLAGRFRVVGGLVLTAVHVPAT